MSQIQKVFQRRLNAGGIGENFLQVSHYVKQERLGYNPQGNINNSKQENPLSRCSGLHFLYGELQFLIMKSMHTIHDTSIQLN